MMSKQDYQDGLKGKSEAWKFGTEAQRDWEAGARDRLANQDLADRIRNDEWSYISRNDHSSGEANDSPGWAWILALAFLPIGAIVGWNLAGPYPPLAFLGAFLGFICRAGIANVILDYTST